MPVIQMEGWAARASRAVLSAEPPLECPRCEALCAATNVTAEGATVYRCSGHGHRAISWRIDVDGNMLRGEVGRRFY